MRIAETTTIDTIPCEQAGTLSGLLRQRILRTPTDAAYLQFDPAQQTWRRYTWSEIGALLSGWQKALARENLAVGERVAILLNNSVEWVCFDQAALSLGLAVVPLYTSDNPENIAYILADSGARLLLVGSDEQWRTLALRRATFPALRKVLCVRGAPLAAAGDIAVARVDDWLAPAPPQVAGARPDVAEFDRSTDPNALATIVYTSGTTGRPKGVMLSHRNILWNAEAVLKIVRGYREDFYLSFLPLSHAFERTAGYYIPMMAGSCVAFARSIDDLPADLLTIRPMVLIAVPRIFERVYAAVQTQLRRKSALARRLFDWTVNIGWRRFEAMQGRGTIAIWERLAWPLLRRLVADKILSRLGGRIRLAISGGAPLYPNVSRCFVGLGLPLLQGYGLTEAAPVVAANRLEDNLPASVGTPLPGVEVKIGANDELLVHAPSVMLGYWNRPDDTHAAVDTDGWLHTGDKVQIENRRVFISGRLKEILVTSTGEKVSPADLEMAVDEDPLFDQSMIVGEGKPYLAALLVLNQAAWKELAITLSLNADDPAALRAPVAIEATLERVTAALQRFPGQARVYAAFLTLEPWTIDNGLITPTLKLKRPAMEERFAAQISRLYAEHDLPLPAESTF